MRLGIDQRVLTPYKNRMTQSEPRDINDIDELKSIQKLLPWGIMFILQFHPIGATDDFLGTHVLPGYYGYIFHCESIYYKPFKKRL